MMDILHDTGIWLALSFAIFLTILWKYAKNGFVGMIDNRIADIKKELQTSENLRIEAQELLAQYQRKHRDAVKEAEAILANAETRAEEIGKQADIDIADMVARREKQLSGRIQQMEMNARAEIREYAAELAVKATREIIQDGLDKKSSSALLDGSIKSLAAAVK